MMGRETDRQMTVRHLNRGTDRLADRKTDGQRGVQDSLTARLVDGETYKQTDGHMEGKLMDRKTDILIDSQTYGQRN